MIYRIRNAQSEMIAGCPRKWTAYYPFRLEKFQTEAQAKGNQVHSQLEAMAREQRTRPWPPESWQAKLAREMYELLPPREPGSDLLIEVDEWIAFSSGGLDFEVNLRNDWASKPWLVDYKTTGAPYRGAMLNKPTGRAFWTLQTLKDDFQAHIYARALMAKWQVESIPLRWIYGSTKAPRAWAVDGVFHYEETDQWFQKYVIPGALLRADLWEAKDQGLLSSPQDVALDSRECEGTGHFCDYGGHCNMQPAPAEAPSLIQLRIPHPRRDNRGA